MKGADELYSGVAECRPHATGATCLVEGDGGGFLIEPNGAGLRLTLGDRLEIEGERDVSPDLAQGDNKVMLLGPATGSACSGR